MEKEKQISKLEECFQKLEELSKKETKDVTGGIVVVSTSSLDCSLGEPGINYGCINESCPIKFNTGQVCANTRCL